MTDFKGLSFGHKRSEATTVEFENNRAYVIGINAYSNGIPPLRTAVADAERLGTVLAESHGYMIRAFPRDGEPTLANLRQLINVTLPQEVGEKDRVIVYFAGHGIALDGQDGPQGYLVPADANREDRTSLLPMTDLNEALAKLPCRHLLLILDCCFAGAFRWSSTREISVLPSVIHRERYERYIKDPAWQVLTSAAYNQKAMDVLSGSTIGERIETAEHSPFAEALFCALAGKADLIPRGKDGLPGGDGVITASELYLYLRQCVETATIEQGARQTPELWPLRKHDKGEYILLTPGHELNLPPAPELTHKLNPWRGLHPYEEADHELFFGRRVQVRQLHRKVVTQPFTVVLGASGTGKSSFVKAGYLSRLRRHEHQWFIVEQYHEDGTRLAAIRPGRAPLKTLSSLVVPGENSGLDNQTSTFSQRVSKWAECNPKGKLLLVIDQFEELITQCNDHNERSSFIDQLAEAVERFPDRFRLVVTVRSDFEPQFLGTSLGKRWADTSRFVIPPLLQDELRDIIEQPASLRVLRFDPPALVDKLINNVIHTPGALSLLSFTLSEMYTRYLHRKDGDRNLTIDEYNALGGVVGALRNRATNLYNTLGDQKADPSTHGRGTALKSVMRSVMLRMVSIEGGELTRCRVPDADLVYRGSSRNELVKEVLGTLEDAQLIVRGREHDGEPYVEPSHDALIRGWDKLLEWVQEEQEQLTLRRSLTPAAHDWKNEPRALWHTDPRLSQARGQLRSCSNDPADSHADDGWLNALEAEFVDMSEKVRVFARNVKVAIAAVVFAVVTSAMVFSFIQWRLQIRETLFAETHFLASSTGFMNADNSVSQLIAEIAQRRTSLLPTKTNDDVQDSAFPSESEKKQLQVALDYYSSVIDSADFVDRFTIAKEGRSRGYYESIPMVMANILQFRCLVLHLLGRMDDANEAYQDAIPKIRDLANKHKLPIIDLVLTHAYLGLANLELELERPEEAIAALDAAESVSRERLTLIPDRDAYLAQIRLAHPLPTADLEPEIRSIYEQLIVPTYNDFKEIRLKARVEISFQRMQAYAKLGDTEKAVDQFQSFMEASVKLTSEFFTPDNRLSHAGRLLWFGWLLALAGDDVFFERAQEYLCQAELQYTELSTETGLDSGTRRQIRDNHALCLSYLIPLDRLTGNTELAISHVNALRVNDPENPENLCNVAAELLKCASHVAHDRGWMTQKEKVLCSDYYRQAVDIITEEAVPHWIDEIARWIEAGDPDAAAKAELLCESLQLPNAQKFDRLFFRPSEFDETDLESTDADEKRFEIHNFLMEHAIKNRIVDYSSYSIQLMANEVFYEINDAISTRENSSRLWLAILLGSSKGNDDKRVYALRTMLRSNDGQERIAAAFGLAIMGPAAAPALPELTAMLDNKHDETEITAACLAFSCIGSDAMAAVPELAELADREPWDACYTLCRISPHVAVQHLLRIFTHRQDPLTTQASSQPARVAFESLVQLGPDIEPFLLDEYAHQAPLAQGAILRMLMQISPYSDFSVPLAEESLSSPIESLILDGLKALALGRWESTHYSDGLVDTYVQEPEAPSRLISEDAITRAVALVDHRQQRISEAALSLLGTTAGHSEIAANALNGVAHDVSRGVEFRARAIGSMALSPNRISIYETTVCDALVGTDEYLRDQAAFAIAGWAVEAKQHPEVIKALHNLGETGELTPLIIAGFCLYCVDERDAAVKLLGDRLEAEVVSKRGTDELQSAISNLFSSVNERTRLLAFLASFLNRERFGHYAADVIGEEILNDDVFLEVLVTQLDHTDPTVRRNSAYAIMRSAASSRWRNGNWFESQKLEDMYLSILSRPADSDLRVRLQLARTLHIIQPPNPDALEPIALEALKSEDPLARADAVEAIEWSPRSFANKISDLLRLADDSNVNIREGIARLLSARQVMSDQSLEDLVRALDYLSRDESPSVRRQAAVSWSEFRGRPTSPNATLLSLLEDSDSAVRLEATLSVCRLRLNGAELMLKLLENLKHPSPALRQATIATLDAIEIGDHLLVINALTDRLNDTSIAVRVNAACLHWKLSRTETGISVMVKALAEPEGNVAIPLLAKVDPKPISEMIEIIRSGESTAMMHAIQVLGEIGPAAAVAVDVLKGVRESGDSRLQRAAVIAIKKIVSHGDSR